MECLKAFTIYSILLIVSTYANTENNHGSIITRLHRIRRQQKERWTWGTSEGQNNNNNNRISATSSPCDPYNPPVPNFLSDGQRKADAKCFEYIWNIKLRSDKAIRRTECRTYLMDNGTLPRTRNLVVGGHNTISGEYPHMGAIGWKATKSTWIFKCGSSLISENFVLTAGHCTKASTRDDSVADVVPKIVRLGDKNIIDILSNKNGHSDANIEKIIPHPKYAPPKKYYDIALMKLESPVTFSKFIQPACLWTRADLNGLSSVTVTGWGVFETAEKTSSPELQAGHVDIVSPEQCDQALRPSCNRHWCGIQDHQVCAGKLEGGVDACQGDSGGPLQVKLPLPITNEGNMNMVVGVTSFGVDCGLPKLPGIYTKVSPFVEWIENIVWP